MKTLILFIAFFSTLGTYAQKSKNNVVPPKSTVKFQSSYSCPMHTEVVSNEPGKCTKCNMDLVLNKKEEMKKNTMKIYECPMHQDVISNESGKCPVCNRSLVLSKKEQMKMDVVNKYTCAMHGDVISGVPGKCAKCGMPLTKAKASLN